MEGLLWVACSHGAKCDKPVKASETSCKIQSFVAAARHAEGFMPGVLLEKKSDAQIPWDCKSHDKTKYYMLSNKSGMELVWEAGANGNVPLGAICGGKSENGEVLYIGRSKVDSSFLSGKIHPSMKVCYIAHEGKEKIVDKYEVLCAKSVPVLVKE